jgi:NADP-dependent 3-hydroxy acid dehydrogenase YdfG
MLRAEDLGRTICWVAMQPPHMCVNQIIVSPAWNRFYTGTGD